MVKEKTDRQKGHDDCVREIANELKMNQWSVRVNVEGSEKPPKIGKLTPDIEATKGCLRRICEVVTEKDFQDNKEQYIEFKNYCDEYDFHLYIVDKDGKRRQIDPKTFGKE
jgi:hypothetical protein